MHDMVYNSIHNYSILINFILGGMHAESGRDCSEPDSSDNCSFRLLPMSSAATIEKCKLFPEDPSMDTIFISSYPKSGTTWLQAIVLKIVSENIDDFKFQHISDYTPFYEIDQTWTDESSPVILDKYRQQHKKLGCRIFNTHLRQGMLPAGESVKYIYIVRSGKDVATSFFHHLTHQLEGGYLGNFNSFIADWCDGKLIFGNWIEHIKEWHSAAKALKNVLFLKYQDLLYDLPLEMKKIASFLGKESLSPERLVAMSRELTFLAMREDIEKYQPISVVI